MTGGEAVPKVDQAAPLSCTRCGGGPNGGFHLNWDVAGPVCSGCWLADVEEQGLQFMEEAWEEHDRDMRECEG